MDPDEPVDEHSAHLGRDLGLVEEVVGLDILYTLHFSIWGS